jgi:hypothetical protein
MSHHSDDKPFTGLGLSGESTEKDLRSAKEKLRQEFEAIHNSLGLGATGQYPNGKLAPHDEGEFRYAIAADVANQRVLIDFGKPMRSIGFTAEKGEEFMELIHAKLLELRGIK